MLNYKEAINSIKIDEKVVLNLNSEQCDCTRAILYIARQKWKRIITRVLKIIENHKLKKLLIKDLNYGEPKTIKVSKDFSKINSAAGSCIENTVTKSRTEVDSFQT